MKVAINGAGIAGPTLAYWLSRYGHEPVLIEQAPRRRSGGYIVDFWGAGYDVASMMGLQPRLHELGYDVKEVRFVGSEGRQRGGFSTDAIRRTLGGRFVSLKRSDLAAAIYTALDGKVETIFDDSIATIDEGSAGVHVSFNRHGDETFDVVAGADGLHSRVRELQFGPTRQFEVYLGYKAAAFELQGYPLRDEQTYVSYAEPGRQVSRFSMRDGRTLFLFVYKDPSATDIPLTHVGRKATLRNAFGDAGWECPQILKRMDDTDEIYFDRISQIQMRSWIKGRTALVGDAAACVSLLAGEGSGLAMSEAFVLAGELARAQDNPMAGLANYQTRMMPFLQHRQRAARRFATSFIPKTTFGITLRNIISSLFAFPFVGDFLLGRLLRSNLNLPRYDRG
ncbi:FAD-binding domain [Rhizobium ruizarguesonis]|uniref:FAD-binding domain n=1 Tax=Rhizobium ruizarguesonis TaxID=2081791 RepID=UPI0013C02B72|nr:FAD-binding domain [Rhizobium ruizarguesonis]NEJ02587.1 FAD-binding domain [Rhizobium ruizarguesonis]NEJ39715.1 FAD-binding domain [Rhizobium ruizarguesonis]